MDADQVIISILRHFWQLYLLITKVCLESYSALNGLLLACLSVRCDIDLGAEDHRLPDVAFTASSQKSTTYPPYQGRLKYQGHNWVARHHNRYVA